MPYGNDGLGCLTGEIRCWNKRNFLKSSFKLDLERSAKRANQNKLFIHHTQNSYGLQSDWV